MSKYVNLKKKMYSRHYYIFFKLEVTNKIRKKGKNEKFFKEFFWYNSQTNTDKTFFSQFYEFYVKSIKLITKVNSQNI